MNCKQSFQGQLSLDLAAALVSFAEETYGHPDNDKWDKLKVLGALLVNIITWSKFTTGSMTNTIVDRMETTEMMMLINKMLSLVDQTKKDLQMNSWVHMPEDSDENSYYRALCGEYEAFAYIQLGHISLLDFTEHSSEESRNITITQFRKARAIYNLCGMTEQAEQVTADILQIEMIPKDEENPATILEVTSGLKRIKNDYEQELSTTGMDTEVTIQSGLLYARALWSQDCYIKATRLVTKLVPVSRRVLGPEHRSTIEADEILEKCNERYVRVLPAGKLFQALQHKNDGEMCVVKGPITEPRQIDNERTHRVMSDLILPQVGCPVICHGLVSASHLNGKLGEVRNGRETNTGLRLGVCFEKKSWTSALVKPKNLRIAFELPSEEL
jgi:hypothetical protein